MSHLYLTEQGSSLKVRNNQFYVDLKDGTRKILPSDLLESIQVFGTINITTRAIETCLKKGINLVYYSTKGSYFGRLISTNHVNVKRQRQQARIYYDEKFKIDFCRRITKAKINNQRVILRRYYKKEDKSIELGLKEMKMMSRKIDACNTIEEVMGCEGNAARIYFKCLGKMIKLEFQFNGRSKRPPKDEFNSLISLGYSIVLNEIYGKIESKGLNPYFGIIHKDREKHPSLASDLIEEWRAVLIDAVAMSLVNGNEICKEDFYIDDSSGGVFLKNEGFKKFIKKLEKKLNTSTNYISYINYPVSYRRAIDLQINQLVKALENEDASLYEPIEIR